MNRNYVAKNMNTINSGGVHDSYKDKFEEDSHSHIAEGLKEYLEDHDTVLEDRSDVKD